MNDLIYNFFNLVLLGFLTFIYIGQCKEDLNPGLWNRLMAYVFSTPPGFVLLMTGHSLR